MGNTWTRGGASQQRIRDDMLLEWPNYQITNISELPKSHLPAASKYAQGGVSYGIIRLLHRRMGGSVGGGGSATGRGRERNKS